ncbi:hypothetical protein Leryth_001074 [Lithospermum erythrorhizon]|nr:hypothetical protein Leryth_001074 [Lithospermum erythrorhizon]
MKQIIHFSHDHPLILKNQVQKLDGGVFPDCYCCSKQVSSGPAYRCEECQYFMHKNCAEIPLEITHPMHSYHKLRLLAKSPYNVGTGTCNACSKGMSGFVYHCSICYFDLDIHCAFLERTKNYKHISHDHPLTYHPRLALIKCDACGVAKPDGSFQCVECPLWIHENCAYLQTSITFLPHIHSLALSFRLPVAFLAYNVCCSVCQGRIDPGYWVYHCESCKYFVHLKCMVTGTLKIENQNSIQAIESSNGSQGSAMGSGSSWQHQPHQGKKSDAVLMEELEKELSNIIGLEDLKEQLRTWAKGLLLDYRRQKLGINVGARKPPHMAFLGNPGTGKTTVARILGRLLHNLGVLSSDKVVEVQRTDLVAEYLGQTGPKTKAKIDEAEGGILFVDEAYRLIVPTSSGHTQDLGLEALEEIMSVMEGGKLSIIFAGYREPMQRVLASNEGFRRRINTLFIFDNYSCEELAKILDKEMTKKGSKFFGFQLDPSCSINVVAALIKKMTTEEQRNKMNAGMVDQMLTKARENLDRRLPVDCADKNLLVTITFKDLEVSLESLNKNQAIGFESNK